VTDATGTDVTDFVHVVLNNATQDVLRYTAQNLEMTGRSIASNEWNHCFRQSKQAQIAKFYFVQCLTNYCL